MPKRPSKRDCQRKHALRRARSRYGIAEPEIKKIRSTILGGHEGVVVFAEKQSLRLTRFVVELEGQHYPVVYDRIRKSIVTFLPKEAIDYENKTFKPKDQSYNDRYFR